mmetsp:Transcript_36082/g.67270  ORF Transcript_36082/g.67270 Transcript_36082/m.67270 type:complete len:431 (+) Transcript_36082:1319-2611(+)
MILRNFIQVKCSTSHHRWGVRRGEWGACMSLLAGRQRLRELCRGARVLPSRQPVLQPKHCLHALQAERLRLRGRTVARGLARTNLEHGCHGARAVRKQSHTLAVQAAAKRRHHVRQIQVHSSSVCVAHLLRQHTARSHLLVVQRLRQVLQNTLQLAVRVCLVHRDALPLRQAGIHLHMARHGVQEVHTLHSLLHQLVVRRVEKHMIGRLRAHHSVASRLLPLHIPAVAAVKGHQVAGLRVLAVHHRILGMRVGLEEVPLVTSIRSASHQVHRQGRVASNQHRHRSAATRGSGWALTIHRDVSRHHNGVATVPSRAINPIQSIDQCSSASITSIDGGRPFDVHVPHAFEQAHQHGLRGLALVHQTLRAHFQPPDLLPRNLVLLQEIVDHRETDGVDVFAISHESKRVLSKSFGEFPCGHFILHLQVFLDNI